MSNFDFKPSDWYPVQDKEVLEFCRNLTRDDMINFKHANPDYKVRIVPNPCSAIAAELFNWIWRSDVEDKKTVIIFPNSWRDVYTAAANMCNHYNVSARNIVAFCMDEWADEHGNVAPLTYEPSLGGHFLREFYGSFREDLRPDIKNMHYYTNENIGCYSQMIEDEGGADLAISATGWVGHTAFIDPGINAFKADSIEEFLTLGARFVDNHRLTLIQNSNSALFGACGDMYATPYCSVSIGPKEIFNARDHLERLDLGYLGGYSSWERMVSRLQCFGPVSMDCPASITQLTKDTVYMSEDMAKPIEKHEFISF